MTLNIGDIDNFPSADQLTDEQREFIHADQEHINRYAIRLHKIEAAAEVAAKLNEAAGRVASRAGTHATAPAGIGESVSEKGDRRVSVPSYLRSSMFPTLSAEQLVRASDQAYSQKVRDLELERAQKLLSGLCDHLDIAEEIDTRVSFMYALISWILVNTASTENNIDSVVGDGYSSVKMLDYLDHDLRPLARALAEDARRHIQWIAESKEHPMHRIMMRMAHRYDVAKTPWLLYDGIDATQLTPAEYAKFEKIKTLRLSENAAQMNDRGVLPTNKHRRE